MKGLLFDFVVYDGDPDEGAQTLASQDMLDSAQEGRLAFPDVYGAITLFEDGKALIEPRPDPAIPLVTNFVKSVRYVIDNEPETVLLSESEHGFLLEPSGDEVLVSFFAGDPYEPEESFLDQKAFKLEAFGEQVLAAGERLRDLVKVCDPNFFDRDEYVKSLLDFLEEGKKEFKTFKLKGERGLRVT